VYAGLHEDFSNTTIGIDICLQMLILYAGNGYQCRPEGGLCLVRFGPCKNELPAHRNCAASWKKNG
jgi:hypothetical protein